MSNPRISLTKLSEDPQFGPKELINYSKDMDEACVKQAKADAIKLIERRFSENLDEVG
jgi:hypothetical protein